MKTKEIKYEKLFAFLLIFVLLFCSCQNERQEENWDIRPMLCVDDVYYIDPYMPVKELPEGYKYAGTLTEEQANGTGLEGIEYYTNPETEDFYTWQETGTPIGSNVVDTAVRSMHYLQWIPLDEQE